MSRVKCRECGGIMTRSGYLYTCWACFDIDLLIAISDKAYAESLETNHG